MHILNHSFKREFNYINYFFFTSKVIKYNFISNLTNESFLTSNYTAVKNSFKSILSKQIKFKNFVVNNYDLAYPTHPWHIVDKSPWPFISGLSAFFLLSV